MSELRFSCGTLESSHQQEQTERISVEYYWPRTIVICVILLARMFSADDFLQTCNITLILSGHVAGHDNPNARMRKQI